MQINRILNSYCRKFGRILMFLLPLFILFFMFLGNFEPDRTELFIAGFFWFLLLLNSILFSLLGFSNYRSFNKEARKKAEGGFPVESLEGFSIISRFVTQTLASTFLITVVVGISLVLFVISISVIPTLENLLELFPSLGEIIILTESDLLNIKNFLRILIMFSAIGLILIAIGILLLLKIPEKPSFEIGAFLRYYNPRSTPMALDNILSDSIIAFVDPITRMRFDEWTTVINHQIRDNFEPNLSKDTRLERAREKILLLFYLKKRMPSILSSEAFEKELSEVIHKESIPNFLKGVESGIDISILNEIFDRLANRMPEIFTIIDRLVIELTDNLEEFRENQDIWVTTSAPEKVSGNQYPFRLLVFAINRDLRNYKNKKRLVTFHVNGAQNNFMEKIDYSIALDEAEDLNIHESNLPFISEKSNDILGILSKLLQIGDAVWFTVERKSFKSHLFHLSITESNRGSIFGETVRVDLVRDFMFYIQTYGGKLSALTGVILPLISFLIPF